MNQWARVPARLRIGAPAPPEVRRSRRAGNRRLGRAVGAPAGVRPCERQQRAAGLRGRPRARPRKRRTTAGAGPRRWCGPRRPRRPRDPARPRAPRTWPARPEPQAIVRASGSRAAIARGGGGEGEAGYCHVWEAGGPGGAEVVVRVDSRRRHRRRRGAERRERASEGPGRGARAEPEPVSEAAKGRREAARAGPAPSGSGPSTPTPAPEESGSTAL